MFSGGLDKLDTAIKALNEREKTQLEFSKYTRVFSMPTESNKPDGSRQARIRFLVPLEDIQEMLVHNKWQGETTVCPKLYGQACQWCNMTEDQFKESGYTNKTFFLWAVWNYDGGRDRKGEIQIFAYEVNSASPLVSLQKMVANKKQEAELLGRSEDPIMTYDVLIDQVGVQAKRIMTCTGYNPSPFALPNGLKVPSPQQWKDSFTFLKSKALLPVSLPEPSPLQKVYDAAKNTQAYSPNMPVDLDKDPFEDLL